MLMKDNDSNYDFAVSAFITHKERLLLLSHKKLNTWINVGGHIEANEDLEMALWREVLEETGIKAEVKGLIAIRNRIYKNENSIYLIFLLQAKSEDFEEQESEVDKIGFFNLSQLGGISNLQALSKTVIKKVLKNEHKILHSISQDDFPEKEYGIFC